MKKTRVTALFMAAAMMSAVPVQCAEDVKVMLDGAELSFDVPPQIIEDRTFVPLRVIFEAMGAAVDWNNDTRTVTAKDADTTVEMTIDNSVIKVNSEEKTLDVAPCIINDRTLVPARAVAESFGADVQWNDETRTVIITSEAKETVTPESTDAPQVTETPAATTAPAQNSDFLIENAVKNSEMVSAFKFIDVTKNSEGKYDIEYSVDIYQEGNAATDAKFNCLDAEGKVVDVIEKSFKGVDYSVTTYTEKATIDGATVKIELAE